MNASVDPKEAAHPEFRLKPDYVDILSPKVQMIFAGVAVLVVCLCSWSDSLRLGLLQDDFVLLDSVRRLLHGDYKEVLEGLVSGLAGSASRGLNPLALITLLFDQLIWAGKSSGFHLTNLLILACSSTATGLIALELSGLKGNRLAAGAGIWAALLFAVYPLQVEAVSPISGRADLLGCFFSLVSVFCFLRFRLLKESAFFYCSLAGFVGALLCKDSAAILPLIITAADVLLQPLFQERTDPAYKSVSLIKKLSQVLAFWFVLGFFATLRLVLHDYSAISSSGGSTPIQLAARLIQGGTLMTVLFPLNLELVSNSVLHGIDPRSLIKVLRVPYLIIAAGAAIRLLCRSASWRIIAFLLFWLAAAFVSSCQAGGIAADLSGSRNFMLCSAPFVMLISFLALPAIDDMSKVPARIFACVGSLSLLVVLAVWSYWLNFNMKAWLEASESLSSFKEQVRENLSRIAPGKSILVLNPPENYHGAGMLTSGRQLLLMLGQGLDKKTRAMHGIAPTAFTVPKSPSAVMILPPSRSLSPKQELDFSSVLKTLLANKTKIDRIFVWQAAAPGSGEGYLLKWEPAQKAEQNYAIEFSRESCAFVALPDRQKGSQLPRVDLQDSSSDTGRRLINLSEMRPLKLDDGNWTIEEAGGRTFKISKSGLRIKPGNEDILLVLPSPQISPLEATIVELTCRTISGSGPPLSFMWSQSSRASKQALIVAQSVSGASLPDNRASVNDSSPDAAADASSRGLLNSTDASSAGPQACEAFFTWRFGMGERQVLKLGHSRIWAQTPVVGSLALFIPRGDYEIELEGLSLR